MECIMPIPTRIMVGFAALIVLFSISIIDAQPPAAKTETRLKVGPFRESKPNDDGVVTVTITVTTELAAEEAEFVGESVVCNQLPITPESHITVNRGPGGTPALGKGPAEITYHINARPGSTLEFRASMKYKDAYNLPAELSEMRQYLVRGLIRD
jgi:hypothetical protein